MRARQHGHETDRSTSSDSGAVAGGARRRRSSMAVLYHRVVRSEDAPVHMQYMAGALFALQPSLFVVHATRFGRKL